MSQISWTNEGPKKRIIKIRKMINNNINYNIYTFNIPIIQYNYINYFT